MSIRSLSGQVLAIALLAGVTAAAQAADAPGPTSPEPTSKVILQTDKHGNGIPFAYPLGKPLITARITEFEPGAATPRHRHVVPLFAYILEGELTIYSEDGTVHHVKAGDAFMEGSDWHYGRNEGGAKVKLLAVYVGEEGAPLAVRADPAKP